MRVEDDVESHVEAKFVRAGNALELLREEEIEGTGIIYTVYQGRFNSVPIQGDEHLDPSAPLRGAQSIAWCSCPPRRGLGMRQPSGRLEDTNRTFCGRCKCLAA
jgi:hypothetical protein